MVELAISGWSSGRASGEGGIGRTLLGETGDSHTPRVLRVVEISIHDLLLSTYTKERCLGFGNGSGRCLAEKHVIQHNAPKSHQGMWWLARV